jgi:uncharacterized protein (DUF952 family)
LSRVYKILDAAAWNEASQAGRFHGAAIDLTDGYIHLSSADQARETARRHFAGQAGLVLVAFDSADLGAALRWEPSRGGDLFPHLYGPLDPALALEVRPLILDDAGVPVLGPLEP